ncbi:Ankyrin repeat-containing domain protein [Lactarius tabidus]
MKYFFMRLEKYIGVRPTAAMTEIIVQIMVEVISILGIVTKEIRQRRFKKYFKELFGIHRVEDAFQRLEKLTQEEVRMAEVEILTIASRIDENVIHVEENMEGVNEGVQSVHMIVAGIDDKLESAGREVGLINTGVTEVREKMQAIFKYVSDLNRNESRKDLRQWINPPDPSSNLRTASDNHHEGTAAWCTEGKTFANWMESGSLLWIHGKPGSGKTILSSVIIKHIESMPNAGSIFLAYFYFDFKDEGKKDLRALLSSLLDQLSDQSDHFRDVLRRSHSEHRDGSKKPHDDELLRCLRDMLTIARSVPIYLVMDALDECPDDSGDRSSRSPRGKVLSVVAELVELWLPNLRLCITSRPELDIRTIIKPLAPQEISLHEESGQNQDINTYVTFVIQLVNNWRASDKEMVISELTKNADGMFRWVYCQLEVLRKCLPKNLRRVLKELPKSLDETYQRILKEINNANQKEAHRLLQCLAVAYRPLRVEELADVLALDIVAGGIPSFNENWRWADHEAAVLSACSSLVSVVVDYNGSRVVQFAHFSVKEFLTSDRLASMKDVSQFHIASEPSHVILAQACFGVLLFLDDHTSEGSFKGIPLYRYAATNWVEHAQVGNVELQIKDALDCFFDMDEAHLAAWLRVCGRRGVEYSRYEDPPVPLYFAASYGFSSLVERLIAKRPQAINFCGRRGTPLHSSVRGGHIGVVKLLLAHGADINSRSADNSTPLHIALQKGHLEIAKWLLKSGADVDSQEKCDLTPLHLAASQGQADICRILLKNNADVHMHDNKENTPFHLAASRGHLEIVRILLERNAEVDSRDDRGATPLLSALKNGHADVARLLLDHNADAKVCRDSGVALLHIAARRGHFDVARILLECDTEINSQDDHGRTPLLIASQNGHADVARLLLDHKADANVRHNTGVTPLHKAAIKGHVEVARLLLERNAEINSRDDRGATPILSAMQNGHTDLARLLLDHNADAKVCGDSGVTLLHLAATNGHFEVTRILLERDAKINSQDDHGYTPLLMASEGGHRGVVRLLLDYNVDVHLRTDAGYTPLHLAAIKGHVEVARMLLEHNAEVNSRTDHGSTPLLLASERGTTDIVQLLLDHNADPDVRDGDGDTLLHCAAVGGRPEVTRFLLKLNVEVNPRNNEGSTPLHLASAGYYRTSKAGNPDLVRLLLDHGADAQVRNLNGQTASEVARGPRREEIVQLLAEHAEK